MHHPFFLSWNIIMVKSKNQKNLSSKQRRLYVQNQPVVTKKQSQPKQKVKIDTTKTDIETFSTPTVDYDPKEVVNEFIELTNSLRKEYLGMVLMHQASRTAISQVMDITSKEFGAPFVEYDDEFDEGIADVFKIMFFRNMITTLNKRYHGDAPIDTQAIIQLLFFPSTMKAPEVNVSPAVKKLSRQMEQLHKLLSSERTGFFGLNGERNVKPNSKR